MRAPLPLAVLFLAVGLAATGCDSVGNEPGSTPDFIPVSPKQTYLKTDDAGALDAPAVRLSSYGVAPGDYVCGGVVGDFTTEPGALASDRDLPMLTAVFSATNVLLSSNEMNRVPGALDTGNDVTTIDTTGGSPTDIAEDFDATDGCVEVPAGAVYAFIAPYDARYSDNADALLGGRTFGLVLR